MMDGWMDGWREILAIFCDLIHLKKKNKGRKHLTTIFCWLNSCHQYVPWTEETSNSTDSKSSLILILNELDWICWLGRKVIKITDGVICRNVVLNLTQESFRWRNLGPIGNRQPKTI